MDLVWSLAQLVLGVRLASSQITNQSFTFSVGESGKYQDTQYMICKNDWCTKSIFWEIDGVCNNATLSFYLLSTSFWTDLTTTILYINGDNVATCNNVEMCTYNWVICDDILDFDLVANGYIDPQLTYQRLNVSFWASAIGYCLYQGQYNVYSKATLSCQPPSDATTPSPTSAPTLCDETGGNEKQVTVSVSYDRYPAQNSWQLIDVSSGNIVIMNGSGSNYALFEHRSASICVNSEDDDCYLFELFDSEGDGMSSFFEIFLGNNKNQSVTMGKQRFGDSEISISWCMGLFDNVYGNNVLNISLSEYYDTFITIENLNDNSLYFNDIREQNWWYPDETKSNFTNLIIADGCYEIIFQTPDDFTTC